jgi:hypothetical protein
MLGELHIAAQDKSVPVTVLGISPFVDPASGTASAQLGFVGKTDPNVLLPGVVGTVAFRANAHRGIEIPEVALVYRGQDPFVRVVDNGKARFVPVVLGSSRRGEVEVLKGLNDGATLLVRANTYVRDGESVTVQTTDTP